MDLHVHMVVSNSRMSSRRMDEVTTATQADHQIKVVTQLVHDSWPTSWKLSPKQALEYRYHRDEFTKIDGSIFKGHKIVLPRDLRHNVTEAVHLGHM